MLVAIVTHFAFPSSTLTIWLKRALVAWGLLIAIGGWSYGNFNNKISASGHIAYQQNATDFAQTEELRMQKVVKQFPYYQITFAIFIAISLAVILFVPSPVAKGIAIATAMLFIGCMIVEQISHPSILEYYKSLSNK